ncbi:juvenile hormone esterase-like [Anthonomus grandis grandis]|uniref:juvenile hormone esterase-like n=1 Tax=Anthonomus grandis grandis TaxID=2921223 RepID=UPI0021651AE6|nr:juvenile hormone esterase-like [Anthonomus grandis grandis]
MFTPKVCRVLLIGLVAANVGAQEEGPTVTIPDGEILGAVNYTANENLTFYSFRGIPYAKPPTGNLRFAAPVENDAWNGTFNATYERDICTQLAGTIALTNNVVLGSEDCLHVNVYTTNITGNLPVMVWIHGGTFQAGSNSIGEFPPDYFLEKGVIMAAINYRLGVFGFLSTSDSSASGNWGLKDQVLALKWVKNNIQYFGGDPDNITIFGESAGAASISYLVQSNQTQGLFKAAIMQSGSSLCHWTLSLSPEEKASRVGLRLGIITFSSETLINRLRAVDYRSLKLAENNVTVESYLVDDLLAGLPWGPVYEPDIEGAFFTTNNRSWLEYSEGNFQRVPMIMGFNSNEAGAVTDYIAYVLPVLAEYSVDVQRFTPIDMTSNFFRRITVGATIRTHYFGVLPLSSQGSNLSYFISLDQFVRPIREQATQASKYVDVFYYRFSYKGLLGDSDNGTIGVGHAEELNYLFNLNNTVSAQDKVVRDQMVTLWTNFAKTNNPTPDPESDSVLGTTVWEVNNATTNASSSILYLDIGNSLTMNSNPVQEDWEFYQDLYATNGDDDYSTY